MTFPLTVLTRLLAPDATLIGAVVGIDGSLVRVATARGAIMVSSTDVLTVGDRVLVRNGLAVRAPVAKQVFPV